MRFRQITDEEISKRIEAVRLKIKDHISHDLQQGEDFGEILANKLMDEYGPKIRERLKQHWLRIE